LDEEFDHKIKYFKLYRWDLIRQFRFEKQEEKEALLKIMYRTKQLIIRAQTYGILKRIFAVFDARRVWKLENEK